MTIGIEEQRHICQRRAHGEVLQVDLYAGAGHIGSKGKLPVEAFACYDYD